MKAAKTLCLINPHLLNLTEFFSSPGPPITPLHSGADAEKPPPRDLK